DGHEIADRVHAEVLAELSPAGRGVFLDSLTELVGGLLAEPVACERPVRRARQTSGRPSLPPPARSPKGPARAHTRSEKDCLLTDDLLRSLLSATNRCGDMSGTRRATGRSQRQLALWLLCAASLMIILDGTIVTIALPSIQRDLQFSAANLSWVMNAYLIAFGSLLLLAGRLGDLIGRKRMFVSGLVAFTAASLACALSTDPTMLIAARFAQGIGGAMVSAVSLGMIVTLFPEPHEQAKAIGAFSFVGAAGASIGLVLGGILTQATGWQAIFFVNVPIGVLAGLFAVKVLDGERGTGLRNGADWLGALLVTAGMMLFVYAIVETARYGWGSARTLLMLAAAVVVLAVFVVRQASARTPLLPLRIFAVRNVTGANLAQLLVIAAAFGFQLIITLYMQRILGYGAAASGLGLLPTAAVIGTVSLGLYARVAARFGPRAMLLAGPAPTPPPPRPPSPPPVHAHHPAPPPPPPPRLPAP